MALVRHRDQEIIHIPACWFIQEKEYRRYRRESLNNNGAESGLDNELVINLSLSQLVSRLIYMLDRPGSNEHRLFRHSFNHSVVKILFRDGEIRKPLFVKIIIIQQEEVEAADRYVGTEQPELYIAHRRNRKT